MNDFKDMIKTTLNIFVKVTTGTLIAATLFVCIFSDNTDVPTSILWQLLVVSAVCAIFTPLFYLIKNYIVCMIIHFLLINATVLGLGYLFCWFRFNNVLEALITVLIIAAIYVVIMITDRCSRKKESEKINEKLKSRHEDKNDLIK